MFTKPLTAFLVFSLLMTNFSGVFIFVGFNLNEKYIAEELCINRSKPELHCNGHCYLMKKLKQAEEKEQKQERQSQKLQIQDALVVAPFVFRKHETTSAVFYIPFSTGIPSASFHAIFHPPQDLNA